MAGDGKVGGLKRTQCLLASRLLSVLAAVFALALAPLVSAQGPPGSAAQSADSDPAPAPSTGAALLAAIDQANVPAVRAALAAGADLGFRRASGATGYYSGDDLGYTPLMVAARDSTAAVVWALLDAGADPNHTGVEKLYFFDPNGPPYPNPRTPLMLAAEHNPDPEVALALLAAGAWPDGAHFEARFSITGRDSPRFPYPVVGGSYVTAIGLALDRNPEPAVARLLLQHAKGLTYPDLGWPDSLTFTARYGSAQLVADLLEAGVPVDQESAAHDLPLSNTRRATALHHAAEAGNPEAAAQLLAHGADVDGHSELWTPLSNAVLVGDLQVTGLLLGAGAQAVSGWLVLYGRQQDAFYSGARALLGDAASMSAAHVGLLFDEFAAAENLEALGRLLNDVAPPQAGLDRALYRAGSVNFIDPWNPAARFEMLRVLLTAGARPDSARFLWADGEEHVGNNLDALFPDLFNEFYPDLIDRHEERMEMALLLLEHGATPPSVPIMLYQAAAMPDESALQRALAAGLRLDAVDDEGYDVLQLIGWPNRSAEQVRVVHHVRPHAATQEDQRQGQERAVLRLLAAGADACVRGPVGLTALELMADNWRLAGTVKAGRFGSCEK